MQWPAQPHQQMSVDFCGHRLVKAGTCWPLQASKTLSLAYIQLKQGRPSMWSKFDFMSDLISEKQTITEYLKTSGLFKTQR